MDFDFESITYQSFDDHFPGPVDDELGVRTIFGGSPKDRYREVSMKRVLDQLRGREAAPLPAFPNGWFGIAMSADLKPGDVRPLSVFGKELVMFRGTDGLVNVLDAYCSHLGAHLGHGGRVAGNDIVCPFHAWKFNGEGECVNVAYSQEIPCGTAINKWQVRDRNGFIFLWYHSKDEAPTWEISELEEFTDPEFRVVARRCTHWTSHIQDVVENGIDLPHFRVVHKWNADQVDWSVHGHEYRMAYRIANMRDAERDAPEIASWTQGPGYSFTRFEGALRGVSTHCMTQVEPGVFQLMQLYAFHQDVPDEVAEMASQGSDFEWASDVGIWENKKTWLHPNTTGDDGPVAAYRNWFNQFYSEPVDQGQESCSNLRLVEEVSEGHYRMGPAVQRSAIPRIHGNTVEPIPPRG